MNMNKLFNILDFYMVLVEDYILFYTGLKQTLSLEYLIYKFGNRNVTTYYPAGSQQIDAVIRPVPKSRISALASILRIEAVTYNIELAYLAACIFQESCFSESCYNNNLGHDRTVPSFQGTDWGMCQLSGQYLPSRNGMKGLTEDEMKAKALSADWAIPAFAEIMSDNIKESS